MRFEFYSYLFKTSPKRKCIITTIKNVFFFLESSETDDIFFKVISNILIKKKWNICEILMDFDKNIKIIQKIGFS